MSKIAETVLKALKTAFPNNVIMAEHYINYKNQRLFFDFYIKDLGVLIEVQGKQHTSYVSHFHEDKHAFFAQKRRDRLKIEYVVGTDDYCLVRFNYDEKITPELVTIKIFNALEEGFYE